MSTIFFKCFTFISFLYKINKGISLESGYFHQKKTFFMKRIKNQIIAEIKLGNNLTFHANL